MHQQESFAWHKYRTLPRECLTYITQLPAEVILRPVVAVSFVELQVIHVCGGDTESLDLLSLRHTLENQCNIKTIKLEFCLTAKQLILNILL